MAVGTGDGERSVKNTDRIKITHGGPDLPYDWETERALLASILMDYRVLDDVRYRVNESDFARSHNAELYRLAKSITDKSGRGRKPRTTQDGPGRTRHPRSRRPVPVR
jgi:hypothetical protein